MMSEKGLKIEAKKSVSRKKSEINWRKVCRAMLDRSMPINPLATQPDGIQQQEDNIINISLGSVERLKQRSGIEIFSQEDDFYRDFSEERIVRTFPQDKFFEQVLQGGKNSSKGRRVALIGESGTGKTLLLQRIAHWVLAKTEDVPIWISSSQLGTNLFDQYLRQKWLPQAANSEDIPPFEWQEAFEELLNSGRVWLLIDGVDDRLLQLLTVAQQIRSWTEKVRIVLTCRTHTWKVNQNELSAFDPYKTLEFTYPEQVKAFIEQWFNPTHLKSDRQETGENLGEQLFQALNRPEKAQIRPWVQNPLRLALLCRLWQQHPQDLPNTRAGLYQRLIPEFYQWKAETTPTNAEQQQQLNTALGKLALQAMQAKSFPYQIPHRLVAAILGEDTPLFRLAIRLGWLQPVGVFSENPQEKYYAFFDGTFQEYFAASALDDWRFFLNRALGQQKSLEPTLGSYRVFESHWKQTILLWLGREDVAQEDKEASIEALVEFKDGCGSENFYGKRAYFLAAAGLSEFPDCSRIDEIVTQIVKWGFEDLPEDNPFQNSLERPIAQAARAVLVETHRPKAIALLVQLIETNDDEQIQALAFSSLEKIGKGNPEAIAALEQILATTDSQSLRWQLAKDLGKIDPGNQKAIATFIQLLDPATPEDIEQIALDNLEDIGKGNSGAIATVINLIRTAKSSASQRRAFQCLEIIGQGNPGAIATLVQLIRSTEDEGMRRQLAESLEKIDPGNPSAIAVLVQLLQSAKAEEIRKQAVYSLGEIEPGNPEAISALVQLLKTSEDVFVRWVAVSSLGKIGTGSQEAIDTLVETIKSPGRSFLQKEAIDSLVKIQSDHPVAITALVKLMQYAEDEGTRQEAAESLGKIDPANPEAITALGYLLRTTYDEFTCRQAAYSLGKIEPANPEALKVLIRLLHMSREKDIRSLAAESLGEIGSNSPAAIATLIRVIQSTKDKDTLRQAVKSLGKIGKGNRDAIAVLMGLLQSGEDESIRQPTADSLISLLQDRQMLPVVSALRDYFLYKSKTPDLAFYRIIWYCAQRLPYPEFHQAWYFRPLPFQPEIDGEPIEEETPVIEVKDDSSDGSASDFLSPIEEANLSNLPSYLHQAIIVNPDLSTNVHLVCIDSSQFIEPDNPLVDIYDRMLAQNCPKFEYGVPDSMAKLRLYWNMLRRNYPDKIFILVFEENVVESERKGFSPVFLQSLSKFEGAICVVTEQPVAKLKQFSPKEPQLVQAILKWIEEQSQDISADEIL
jgi:HEAT repeat protein/ABC-type dipeptide/oligopeptide/nickel transport system ATPase component